MALSTTTLSSAVGKEDITVLLANITDLAAGNFLRIDDELMRVISVGTAATVPVGVLRGQNGTQQVAHVSGANATRGLGSDFREGPAGVRPPVSYPVQRPLKLTSYSAAGAISPVAGIHVINGTSALAMTLANPTKDQDGDLMIVIANGKAAHTVTYTAGFGNGGAAFDIATFSATLAGGCILMAMNGFWVLIGNGIATATGATGAPLIT